MDPGIAGRFAGVIRVAQRYFDDVEYSVNLTPERDALKLRARFGRLRISVREMFSDERRKYSYYALDGKQVVVGFDNSPDPEAIRLKYGRIGPETAGIQVPHIHTNDKADLQLTDEIDILTFINWLKANTPHAP